MTQYRDGVTLDVIRGDELAAFDRSIGACDLEEGKRPPWAGPDRYTPVNAGGMDKRSDIVFKIRVHMDGLYRGPHVEHLFCRGDLAQHNVILATFAPSAEN